MKRPLSLIFKIFLKYFGKYIMSKTTVKSGSVFNSILGKLLVFFLGLFYFFSFFLSVNLFLAIYLSVFTCHLPSYFLSTCFFPSSLMSTCFFPSSLLSTCFFPSSLLSTCFFPSSFPSTCFFSILWSFLEIIQLSCFLLLLAWPGPEWCLPVGLRPYCKQLKKYKGGRYQWFFFNYGQLLFFLPCLI